MILSDFVDFGYGIGQIKTKIINLNFLDFGVS